MAKYPALLKISYDISEQVHKRQYIQNPPFKK